MLKNTLLPVLGLALAVATFTTSCSKKELTPFAKANTTNTVAAFAPKATISSFTATPKASAPTAVASVKEAKAVLADLNKLSSEDKAVVATKIKAELDKVATTTSTDATNAGSNQIVAAILCYFVGILGIHRFYLGYTWQGVVQLLTLGGFGIWTLIDFIRIIIGDLQPKGSAYTKTF